MVLCFQAKLVSDFNSGVSLPSTVESVTVRLVPHWSVGHEPAGYFLIFVSELNSHS